MIGKIVLVLFTLASARAQIPSLGFCPDYVPMVNFDMSKFLGIWYEVERYFQLTEVVSRCVTTNYTLGHDGKFYVSNEVTNRFTGIKRIVEGEVKKSASKAEAGKLTVKYTIPLTPETKYSVLETDYDSYAVLWSCSGIGPFHTQNAWVMARERTPPGPVMQKAYAVLDKYKISKMFFVKTNQEDCANAEAPPAAEENSGNQKYNHEYIDSTVATDVTTDAQSRKSPIIPIPQRILKVTEVAKEVQPVETAEIAEEKKSGEAINEDAVDNAKDTEKTA